MLREDHDFDIAIVGGGISCTHVLSTLLRDIDGSGARLRIGVFEKDGEFWRGFPYGRRSSINSLIITALSEFVPDEERKDFTRWLTENYASWRETILREGGAVGQSWLAANEVAIAAGDWDEIYIPRRLYGDFIEERIERQIAVAASRHDASVTKITASVDDIRPASGAYLLHAGDENGAFRARSVVLAIGSPPALNLTGSQTLPKSCLYVNNAYLPSLDENLSLLKDRLEASTARNLLIVGSNATSLELIYMISRKPDLLSLLHKIMVMSRSGAFPHRMSRDRFRAHTFPRMQRLRTAGIVTGDEILKATEADLQDLDAVGVAIGDHLHHLNEVLVSLLEKMTRDEEREFHHRYGMEFTRLVRRAGAEYRDAVDALSAAGKLDVLRASFTSLVVGGDAAARVKYESAGASETCPLDFTAVFNCAGFEDISAHSSSPLLARMVSAGLVSANETGRGLSVDEGFAARPGLFVCGPLLAGLFNDTAKFWHVENVRRIHGLARLVAPAVRDYVNDQALQGVK